MIDRYNRTLPGSKFLFALYDPDWKYTRNDVLDLLEEAERLGFVIDKGQGLEGLTVAELEKLIRGRQ